VLETLSTTPVGRLRHREAARAGLDCTIDEVVRILNDTGRNAVLVEAPDGRLEGIFTSRDLLPLFTSSDESWRRRPVSELMSPSPRTVSTSESLATVLRVMRSGGFRHLPMVDGTPRAAGIVSVRDVLRYVAESFPQEFLNLPPEPDKEASQLWGA